MALIIAASLFALLIHTSYGERSRIRYDEVVIKAPFEMPPIRIPVFPAHDFPITEFGAIADGKTKSTAAIRRAVEACHSAGGGRVVVPAGEWLTGAVHLKSNVNLHVAKGATLFFSSDPADYLPAVRSSWEGWECFNYSPLVYAFECNNVAITGEGRLEARMTGWKSWMERPPAHLEALKQLYTMGSTGVPVEQRQMASGENHLRPQFIQMNRCRNVLLEDVQIRNSPFWVTHLLLCESVVVRRINISALGHNNDGIDPEGTRNVLIEECRFAQGDDAIAIKSGTNHDGWRLNTPSENIVVRNCAIVSGHQLLAIGSELSGGVQNVWLHDCSFDLQGGAKEPFNVLYIKTNRRRGGFVKNVIVERVDASNAKFRMGVFGIETDVLYQWRTLVPSYEERLTPISSITLRTVKARQTATPFRILGDKDMPVQDVTIDNVSIAYARGQRRRYENVQNVRESNVTIADFVDVPDQDNRNR